MNQLVQSHYRKCVIVKVGVVVPLLASPPPLFTVKSSIAVSAASTSASSYILTVKDCAAVDPAVKSQHITGAGKISVCCYIIVNSLYRSTAVSKRSCCSSCWSSANCHLVSIIPVATTTAYSTGIIFCSGSSGLAEINCRAARCQVPG